MAESPSPLERLDRLEREYHRSGARGVVWRIKGLPGDSSIKGLIIGLTLLATGAAAAGNMPLVILILAVGLLVLVAYAATAEQRLELLVAAASKDARAVITAGEYVLIWYETNRTHPEAAARMREYVAAVPAFMESGAQIVDAMAPPRPGRATQRRLATKLNAYYALVTEAIEKMEKVQAMVRTYGLPAPELQEVWGALEDRLPERWEVVMGRDGGIERPN